MTPPFDTLADGLNPADRLMTGNDGQPPRLELTLDDLKSASPQFDADALKLLSPEASLRAKRVSGSTAPSRVRAALARARKRNG